LWGSLPPSFFSLPFSPFLPFPPKNSKRLTYCAAQSRDELEKDRRRLQTQLDALREQLDESHDRRDVTSACSKQLSDSLTAAQQTAEHYREALHAKVHNIVSHFLPEHFSCLK